jgi:hypothetical protein
MLTAFGEREIKQFVQASIDEALKLERAMSQLRSKKRVVVLDYSPIAETVQGEATEIFPFLGTSRLAEVVDRHGADLVVHGHAHHGRIDGRTPASCGSQCRDFAVAGAATVVTLPNLRSVRSVTVPRLLIHAQQQQPAAFQLNVICF